MTEPNRPQSTSDDAPVAAAPLTSYRARWAELISGNHTPRGWAVIAAAIQTADGARVDAFGDPLVRGSEDWCRVAITATEAPAANAKASALPERLPERCLLDMQLLRAWLSAPAAYADRYMATVADLVADRDWSQTADETTQEGLERLVEAAQDAGVFGVDGYRIELHGATGEDGWISRHLLVARPAVGPGLVSELLDTLVPTTPMSGVDSALAVLSTVAREIDTILDGFNVLLQRIGVASRGRSARSAFPPPGGPAEPTATREPSAPDAPRRRGSTPHR